MGTCCGTFAVHKCRILERRLSEPFVCGQTAPPGLKLTVSPMSGIQSPPPPEPLALDVRSTVKLSRLSTKESTSAVTLVKLSNQGRPAVVEWYVHPVQLELCRQTHERAPIKEFCGRRGAGNIAPPSPSRPQSTETPTIS